MNNFPPLQLIHHKACIHSTHAHTCSHTETQTLKLLIRSYLTHHLILPLDDPVTTASHICILHQLHTEQRAAWGPRWRSLIADVESAVSGVCQSSCLPRSWVEGEAPRPYRSCNTVQFSGHRGSWGSAWQTVTLSDPYWNSQQNNNRTLTNLIFHMMTREIIVSQKKKNGEKKAVERRLSISPDKHEQLCCLYPPQRKLFQKKTTTGYY